MLGFDIVGVIEAGHAGDRTSIALRCGAARFVLTAPLIAASAVAEHIRLHGEGVKDIALSVRDVALACERAERYGATVQEPPCTATANDGVVTTARIGASGDLVHSIRHRSEGVPVFPAMRTASDMPQPRSDTAIEAIDHLAIAVGPGELDRWVEFYASVFALKKTDEDAVDTEHSATRSSVVQNADGTVRITLMEPANGRRPSEVQAYIQAHQGAGVQHVALRSRNILKSMATIDPSLKVLSAPDTYYDTVEERVGNLSWEMEALRRVGALVDRDTNGLRLRVFSQPIGSRPTLCFELVERRGAPQVWQLQPRAAARSRRLARRIARSPGA